MKLYICIFVALCSLSPSASFAESLKAGSPELSQLTAMGYEIDGKLSSSEWTVLTTGSNKLLVGKNNERTVLYRLFKKPSDLTDQKEYELLKQINKLNTDLSYQVSVGGDGVNFVVYEYGPYDPKTFAKLVRMIEQADSVFSAYPDLLKLLKGEFRNEVQF